MWVAEFFEADAGLCGKSRPNLRRNLPRCVAIKLFFRRLVCAVAGCACCVFVLPTLAAQSNNPVTTLDTALAETLDKSPLVKAARFARDAGYARAGRERPVSRPSLQALASGGAQGPRVTFPGSVGPDNTVLPNEVGRVDLVMESPIYHAGASAARDRYASSMSLIDLDYLSALTDIVDTVRKRYLDVERAQSAVRVAEEGVDASTRYLQLVDKMIAAGSGKPVDRIIAESQLAEAQDGALQAKSGATLAGMALNQLMGRPLTAPISVSEAQPARAPQQADMNAATQSALRNRKEIVTLSLSLSAARAGVVLAKSELKPSLKARAQITEQTPTLFIHEHYAEATLQLSLPLLDGGKSRYESKEAAAEVKRLEALIEEAGNSIVLDVTQSFSKIKDAESRIGLSEKRRSAALTTLNVAETAYSVGRSSATDVQAAQREVRLASERLIQAKYDLLAALNDFDRATGADSLPVRAMAPMPIGRSSR